MKLIIFDLDGVLLDSREIHYKALNKALYNIDKKYVITEKEHLTTYDGLSTRQKLLKLTDQKGLPESLHKTVWENKQTCTMQELKNNISKNEEIIRIFSHLKSNGNKIAVASNSIKQTIDIVVEQLGLTKYIDMIASNEDIEFPKPNPQIYLYTMEKFGIGPNDTYIFEDSYIGRTAAFESGAKLCPVNNSTELTFDYVCESINQSKTSRLKWQNKKMNILIPMAGEGSRFKEAGYSFPKPIIEVNGEPMIKLVIDNLNIDANYTFIIRKSHDQDFNISSVLKRIVPDCNIVSIDSLTEGAACTTLLAKQFINNDMPLLIANSDQFVEWDSCQFYHSINTNIDGSILTFNNVHPKWSYVQLDENNNVTRVAEKEVISDKATVGIYYFSKGSDYVKYAEQMINKDIRYGKNFNGKGEFYIAPVYNEAIADGKIIKIYDVKKMHGLGTPEDLMAFTKYVG